MVNWRLINTFGITWKPHCSDRLFILSWMFHLDRHFHKEASGYTWSGRGENSNYLSEEGIPYCVLSWDNYTQYFNNDVYAKPFHKFRKD